MRRCRTRVVLARSLLWFGAMKILAVNVMVRDTHAATVVSQRFLRSPVTLGRESCNSLVLDGRLVSRRHGAIVFSVRGLEYVDLHSKNGSLVDGRIIEAAVPTDVSRWSVITVGHCQITALLELVPVGPGPIDADLTQVFSRVDCLRGLPSSL